MPALGDSMSKEGSYERYQSFYNAEDPARWGGEEMPEWREVTELWMRFVAIRDSIPSVILELGCGVGALSRIHPGYIGLEFSFPALKKSVTQSRGSTATWKQFRSGMSRWTSSSAGQPLSMSHIQKKHLWKSSG